MTVRRDPTQLMQIGFLALLSISAAHGRLVDVRPRAVRAQRRATLRRVDPVVAEDSARAHQPRPLGGRLLPRRADRRHGRADADAAARRGAAAAPAELSRGRVARVQEPAREHPARGRDARAALARRRRQTARDAHSRGRRATPAHDRQPARHDPARGRPPALDAAAHESRMPRRLRPSRRSPSARARAASCVTLAVAGRPRAARRPRRRRDRAAQPARQRAEVVRRGQEPLDPRRGHARRRRRSRSPSATTAWAFRPRMRR